MCVDAEVDLEERSGMECVVVVGAYQGSVIGSGVVFGARWIDVARFNRMDRRHALAAAIFAIASVVTPITLGVCVGAIASATPSPVASTSSGRLSGPSTRNS